MATQSSRGMAISGRFAIATLAMLIMLPAWFWPTAADASASARHHGISIIILGKIKHYHHGHGKATPRLAANPDHCPYGVTTEVDSSQYVFFWDGKTYYHDGPGGEMVVSVKETTSIKASISAQSVVGVSIGLDDLVGDAKTTVSGKVTVKDKTTKGNKYEHKIPRGKFGNMEYGSWGYKVTWSVWRTTDVCKVTEIGHGAGTVPTKAVGWYYWSTRT